MVMALVLNHQWHHILKYDQMYGSMQTNDQRLWAGRRGNDHIRKGCKDSRETYWESNRHTECLGHYRNCNRRESNGRNSTKHMGASPVMPVNGEMWNDRRVEQTYWRSMSTRDGRTATSRSWKWLRQTQIWGRFSWSQLKGWWTGIHKRILRNDGPSIWKTA